MAHPYYAGNAVMFGVITNSCTIGVAKSPLRGFEFRNNNFSGRYKQIFVNERLVGIALKHNPSHRPIYISPGNKTSIIESLDIVEKMLRKDKRLPVPLHWAHISSERFKRSSL